MAKRVKEDGENTFGATVSTNFLFGKEIGAALRSGDVNTAVEVSRAMRDSEGLTPADESYDIGRAITGYVGKYFPKISNVATAGVNIDQAEEHLIPTSDNKFIAFAEKVIQVIVNFFNHGYQTIATKVTNAVDGDHSLNKWGSEEIGASGVTYGGAIGIGLAASFLVFITYKIVNKFRNRNTVETESYAINNLNSVITESDTVLKTLKYLFLKEGVNISDNDSSLILNARQPAIELTTFLAEGPRETDGKIISFFKKYAPFIKLVTLGVAGVALGYVAYKNMPAGETNTNEKFSNAVVDADKYGVQWGSR